MADKDPETPAKRHTRDPATLWSVALIALAVILRCGFLILLSQQRLDPDAGGYINRAREFSYLAPWAASSREPLWVALVKSVIAPFDYSPLALRIFTTAMSVAVVILARRVFMRLLAPRHAIVALAFVALNGQLIFLAPRGVREETVMTLLLVTALGAISWIKHGGSGVRVAVPIALLCAVRWELGVVTFVLLAIYMVIRRRGVIALVTVLAVVALLMGPFLVANANRYGDPLYFSSIGPIFCRNVELKQRGLPAPEEAYGGSPLTWAEYYLDVLGPGESLRREVVGLPVLFFGSLYHSVLPIREPRLVEFGVPSRAITIWQIGAAGFVAVAFACILLGALTKDSRKTVGIAMAGTLGGMALYATLVDCFIDEYRHVSFTIPLLAAAVAPGAVRLGEWARYRNARLKRREQDS